MATDVKVRLIVGLLAAGVPRVEATAFVSPAWVPQMADAADVISALDQRVRPRLRALIPNRRGLELAQAAGITNVLVTVGVTETFNRRNVNRSVAESIADVESIVADATSAGCQVDVALSVCFGCPFEGRVDPQRVVDLCADLVGVGVAEVGVADTIGVATPTQVRDLVGSLRAVVPAPWLSLHVHDTRGLGIANVLEAYRAGVRRFDGSAGGLGGCPFAPRSTGNVCSEDALQALVAEGASIDADLARYCQVSVDLAAGLGAELPGRLHRAGMWIGEGVQA